MPGAEAVGGVVAVVGGCQNQDLQDVGMFRIGLVSLWRDR